MLRSDNFISFHDLTPEARFLWASPTIYDVLGYDQDDLLGVPVYDIIFQEDIADGRTAHKENVINDLVATQLVCRYKRKDGSYVHTLAVFSVCYDFIVNCATLLDQSASAYVQLRAHSTVMTRMVGSRKEEFERVKRHHEAFVANSWNHQAIEPEARVCLILNRFTRNLVVMYASAGCEKVFNIDPDDLTGKPILLYIRADDLATFVEQVDIIKGSTVISQMRFWFQSPTRRREIPCEAIIFGASDGIVAVIRRCRPFVRKHLITGGDYYEVSGQGSSWSSGRTQQSYGISPTPTVLATPSPSYGSYELKSPSPPSNVSRSLLNRIRILELGEDERIRPLAMAEDDPTLVLAAASEVPAFKSIVVQNYDDGDVDDCDDCDEEDLGFKHLDITKQADTRGGFNHRE